MNISIGRKSGIFQGFFYQRRSVDRKGYRLTYPDISKQRVVGVKVKMLPHYAAGQERVDACHRKQLFQLIKRNIVDQVDFTDFQLTEHDLPVRHNLVVDFIKIWLATMIKRVGDEQQRIALPPFLQHIGSRPYRQPVEVLLADIRQVRAAMGWQHERE